MPTRLRLLIVIAGVLASSYRVVAEPTDDLAVIVNPENSSKFTASDLESLYLRKERRWSNSEPVVPFNAPVETKARTLFDRAVLAMSPDESARYWLDQRIRAGTTAPREVEDAGLTIKLVARLKGAVAYVPSSADLRGVRVAAVLRAGKLILP